MPEGYIKGQMSDRGSLAGKTAVLVAFDDEEAAKRFAAYAARFQSESMELSIQHVYASQYDIDYHQYKVVFDA